MSAVALTPPAVGRTLLLQSAENAVRLHPGMTSAQLAELVGCERTVLLDLLYDLQRLGRVHAAELTICRLTGRTASVWREGRDPMLARETNTAADAA